MQVALYLVMGVRVAVTVEGVDMGGLVIALILAYWLFRYERKRLKRLEDEVMRLRLTPPETDTVLQERFRAMCIAVVNGETSTAISIAERSRCEECGIYTVKLQRHSSGCSKLVCDDCKPKRGGILL